MKLVGFRVQNYKKIQDTGWVDCDELTVFVGKNESGKTALFRGLSKLKPTDDAKYDPIKEFPHGRYTDEFAIRDWPVSSGKYELSKDDKEHLKEECSCLGNTEKVIVTRYYSGDFTVEFEPEPVIPSISKQEWIKILVSWKKDIERAVAPDGMGETWATLKDTLCKFLEKNKVDTNDAEFELSIEVVELVQKQFSLGMTEEWMKKIFEPKLSDIDGLMSKLEEADRVSTCKDWIEECIPYFLYFGDYEVIRSAIYLPEFLSKSSSGDKSPTTRVQAALFKYVGVDVDQLATLGRHTPTQQPTEDPNIRRQIDELDIKANSASIAMTNKFSDWWKQRKHKFTYKFHGDYFRIWVSDDLDPSDVELEERSLGLRYFFSFYLLFLVEAEEEHRDCVLLLDEPGLHLHGTAQGTLIKFLEKISQKNQTLYTTHSPFMIDGSHLERARAVSESDKGSVITSDVWPKDRDTLFPLQAALGYSVWQSLFVSKKQVMVEGPTDYMFLSVLNQQLLGGKGKGLREDIVMIPMGGTANLGPLASMLIGHEISIAILLDSDPAGLGAMNKIRKLLTDVDKRCIQISQFADKPNIRELEDLIPEEYYLDAVCRAYPNLTIKFSTGEQKIDNIVDRLVAFFKRRKLNKFEKWRPIKKIVEDINRQDDKVPKVLFDIAEKIFEKINSIL